MFDLTRAFTTKPIFILFIMSLSISTLAEGKTLIVVHPQTKFDSYRVAGARTRQLLQDPQFSRKIVLLNPQGERQLTFDPEGLLFEKVISHGGEFDWDDSDQNIVFAGGYVSACLVNTIASVVSQSTKLLNIEIDMASAFDAYDLISSDPVEEFPSRILTLEAMQQKFGSFAFINGLLNGYFMRELGFYKLDATFQVTAEGEHRGTIGNGLRQIKMNFVGGRTDKCETSLSAPVPRIDQQTQP